MKGRFLALICAITLVAFTSGCSTHRHTIGDGPIDGITRSETQWYALWGLVSLGNVDGGRLAGGATDYRIVTKNGFWDIVINMFTGIITIYSRTVYVTT